jgi:hypothetical protein
MRTIKPRSPPQHGGLPFVGRCISEGMKMVLNYSYGITFKALKRIVTDVGLSVYPKVRIADVLQIEGL